MLHWRIVFYLLQFYLFAVSGSLSYLSLRAWLDPSLPRRKREDPHRVPRLSHLLAGVALFIVAAAAITGALREGALGVGTNLFALLRVLGYVVFLCCLPKTLWRERMIVLGAGMIVIGELLLYGHDAFVEGSATSLIAQSQPFVALALTGIGLGLVGYRMVRAILRVRLVDRMVISFAVFGLLLAQVVAFLELELLSSFGVDLTFVLQQAERPLLTILTGVLAVSAIIGSILARDLSMPVTRLGQALRAIGDGNLNQRVDVNRGTDDEMNDLAVEVNRMAAQLKSADELRSDFLSFVSHELRTPLTSIKGFITTLESVDDFSPSERAEMYSIVDSETDRLLRMINELLDLSRIQSGKPLKLHREWFDIGAHLSKVAGMIQVDAQRHRIEVVVPEIPVWIYADPDKVTQIVINLMSNAIKYSPSGGTVSVKLIYNDVLVKISVADEGVGMTSEQAEHIFDKFYRVAEQDGAEAAKRLRRVEGAGIGLYLTRALIEAHDGSISVISEPGSGTVFTVSLPKQPAKAESADEAQPATRTVRFNGALLDATDRIHVPHLVKSSLIDADGAHDPTEATTVSRSE
jgi:signal transduction histidine kinase